MQEETLAMPNKDVIDKIAKSIEPQGRNKLSLAVLASGGGSNLQALIDRSLRTNSYFRIAMVISNNKAGALLRASRANIANHLVDHRAFISRTAFEEAILSHLNEKTIDLIVLAGFMRVLSPSFLARFSDRVINLHPSLLPKHRGLHAIKQAMRAGEEQSGCTVHLVDEGLDTGPIIAQASCPIFPSDELEQVKQRIQNLEHQLLPQMVNDIAQRAMAKCSGVGAQQPMIAKSCHDPS